MSKAKPSNISASVRQKLLNLARERREEFQLVLVRFALERLLYRLSQSRHQDQFILKGAMLFQLWTGQPHRSTLDLDLLGKGQSDTARVEEVFREVCNLVFENDGLVFPADSIHAAPIREDQRYGGVRVHGIALLGTAKIPLQIDIGFGDVVTPRPVSIEYPSLLGLPPSTLASYPRQTVVAEKFEALVSLGIANTRMKDFYDLWILARSFEFSGGSLGDAIRATFARRGTPLPGALPIALTPEFSGDESRGAQWQAFVRRGGLMHQPPTLPSIIEAITAFLWPLAQTLVRSGTFSDQHWPEGGPWRRQ